ncbi:NINE protein [Mycobacterium ulcerans]|uniref:NINE protein n=1 Tax=Mycobacterium ulcerans TaxID=1809 RepID=A0ABY5TVK5_MYCUL|nr:NINE protein [Mycobacterium ulcerans]
MATPNQPGGSSDEPPWVEQPYGQPGPNPQFPPSWGYPAQPGGQPQPYPGNPSYPYPNFAQAPEPQAPFGRDPISGVPLSDKSAATAGLLQLFFGFAGIGRFYVGSNSVATAQLCLGLGGLAFTVFCLNGFPFLIAAVLWGIVDSIMIFTGNVADSYGRKLR